MNISAFCIKRPAFTIVINLIMMIIGIIGYMNLTVRWVPNVTLPSVSIETTYQGANAALVEKDVTKVLEDSLSGVNGITTLTSRTDDGRSNIDITFKLGEDINQAVDDIRSSIERVKDQLPKDISNPVVLKNNPDVNPILFISFYNANLSDRELSDYIDKYIKPTLETVDGVGQISTYGEHVSSVQIRLNPIKMAGAKITIDDVVDVLQAQNASTPSGKIRSADRIYSIITDTALHTPQQFNDLIIRDNQNQITRIRDIGEATIAPKDTDSAFRVKDKPAIALGVIPQSTANPLQVEQHVQQVLLEMKRTLPHGMAFSIDYNQADYIRASIHSVYEAFFEAIFFVWLVIFAFLGSFRATWVPLITVPVCMMSTFAILYFFGFSINTITLMAFVLAIGLVVDDAIVMLENIKRHIEAGMRPMQAALTGSQEIAFPIIVMTLTLAAVYTPIAFAQGLLGILFREFTFTLAGAVIISGLVALTLSPMMCSKILHKREDTRYAKWINQKLLILREYYHHFLVFALNRRRWVMLFLAITALLGILVYRSLPAELAPMEDMNEVDVFVMGPRNASFNYMDNYVRELEAIYRANPNIESYLVDVGNFAPGRSFQVLRLKPKNERTGSIDDIIASLVSTTNHLSGIRANVFTPPPPLVEFADSDEGDNMGVVLMTSGDYRKLQPISQHIIDELQDNPMFVHVNNKLKWNTEQFQVTIDREKAADLKVAVPDITNTISTLLAGRIIGKANDMDVVVQINEPALADPNVFQQIYVHNRDGNMIPLMSLINVAEITAPEILRHNDRLRADTVSITLAPNVKLSDALTLIQNTVQKYLPSDMKYSYSGMAKNYLESNSKTLFTFILAMVFIYLVLVAQFESFIDPLVIMLTVPFAVVGALLALKIFGGSLNVYSNIGFITLIGLIAKHGILITEFANQLRTQGKNIHEAIIESCLLRLRPILMTTAAMVLGALPLALSYGAGAESRQQIGLVIIGGLLFGTLFSLCVVPVTYSYLAKFKREGSNANI